MRIVARLGNISLKDLSDSHVAVPTFKDLLSIEGEELADFSYETFDPSDHETFPGYNSSINLRTGSLKFTFMEQPIHDLYAWAIKFARMKAIYDAASQAAVQRASEVTRMHYDVIVKTPIVLLPRDGLSSADVLVLRLGQITAKNEYLGDPSDTSTIQASLSGISVSSEIFVDEKKAVLPMVDDVAINASIKQTGDETHRQQDGHADMEVRIHLGGSAIAHLQITTKMSDVNLSLTQRQYILLMRVMETIPRALGDIGDAAESAESVPPTPISTAGPPTPITEDNPETPLVNLEPELTVIKARDGETPRLWTALDFEFSVSAITFEVYGVNALHEEDIKKHSIARIALVGTHVGMKRLSDGAVEAEISLKTMSFANTQAGKSMFRDIIPTASHDGKQL